MSHMIDPPESSQCEILTQSCLAAPSVQSFLLLCFSPLLASAGIATVLSFKLAWVVPAACSTSAGTCQLLTDFQGLAFRKGFSQQIWYMCASACTVKFRCGLASTPDCGQYCTCIVDWMWGLARQIGLQSHPRVQASLLQGTTVLSAWRAARQACPPRTTTHLHTMFGRPVSNTVTSM